MFNFVIVIFILQLVLPGLTWNFSKSKFTNPNSVKRPGWKNSKLFKIEPRIVGGKPATFGEVPYQLRIETDKHLCGASLVVHKDLPFVITAAHCIWTGPQLKDYVPIDKISVIGADLNFINYSPREQWFKVQHSAIHPDYDPRYSLNDVGIMFLDRYVFESLGLNHIRLPESNWEDPEFVTVSGWGADHFGGDIQHELQVLESPVVPWGTCKFFLPPPPVQRGFLGPKEMCVGNNDAINRRGICAGDSGGPGVGYNYTNEYWYLAGITSSVPKKACGDPKSAALFTRVTNYVDWIKGYAQGWLDVHGNGNPYQNGSYEERANLKS